MARFEREAKVLAALNHPHIAQIYGVEEGALITELVEGEPLKGPLPIAKAVEYAIQPVINQIVAYPLTKFDGKMRTEDWSKAPRIPGPAATGRETRLNHNANEPQKRIDPYLIPRWVAEGLCFVSNSKLARLIWCSDS
jgi:serine/threonine protein kinase